MTGFRSILLLCITLLAGLATYLFFETKQDRLIFHAHGKGLYIYDRKNSRLHFCTPEGCRTIGQILGNPYMMPSVVSSIPAAVGQEIPNKQLAQPLNKQQPMNNVPVQQQMVMPMAGDDGGAETSSDTSQ